MDKQKRELMIIAILSIVFVLLILRTIGQQKKEALDRVEEEVSSVQPKEAIPQEVKDFLGEEMADRPGTKEVLIPSSLNTDEKSITYRGQGFRDPLKKPEALLIVLRELAAQKQQKLEAAKEQQLSATADVLEVDALEVQVPVWVGPPDLDIRGIMWGIEPAQVIIGNQVFGVGQSVGGVQITAIDAQGVHVKFQNKEFVLGVRSQSSSDKNAEGYVF